MKKNNEKKKKQYGITFYDAYHFTITTLQC